MKALFPEVVIQDDRQYILGGPLILFVQEPAKYGCDAQNSEIVSRYDFRSHWLRERAVREGHIETGLREGRREISRSRPPRFVDGKGILTDGWPVVLNRENPGQLGPPSNWKLPEQDRVDGAEDHSRAADAYRQKQDLAGSEAGVPATGPTGQLEVVTKSCDHNSKGTVTQRQPGRFCSFELLNSANATLPITC